jgi:hypothetical protein
MASDLGPLSKPVPTRLDERVRRLPTVAHYLATLKAGWKVVTVLTLAGLLLGGWYSTTVQDEWRGSTSMELPDVPVYVDLTNTGPPAKPTTIDTTGQLVYSEPVLRAAGRAAKMSVEEVNDNLAISAYPLSRVLIISLVAPTQWQAERGADAAARALLEQRQKLLAGKRNRDDARDMVASLRRKLNRFIAKNDYTNAILQIQQNTIRPVEESLRQYNNSDGRIVNKAYPARRVPKHSELYLTTGAVSGFMIAVAWLWWRPPKPRDRKGSGGGSAVATKHAVDKLREARHGRRDPVLVGSRVDPSSV